MPPPPARRSVPAPGFSSKPAARPASLRPPSGASAPFTEDDLMAETVSDLPSLIDALETDDCTACADVLKLVLREITKNTEHVLLHVDALIDAVTARLELGFTNLGADTPPAQLRLCKHLMQTLTALFDKRTLSQQVSRLPLTGLLADLMGRLLDTADNPVSEPIQSLSKVLNMLLIRVFHNADQNVCFGCVLFPSRPVCTTPISLEPVADSSPSLPQRPSNGPPGRDDRSARAARRGARRPGQVRRACHEGALGPPLSSHRLALARPCSPLMPALALPAVPVEGLEDGQGEPREPQPPRAAPPQRHQPVPRHDSSRRVAPALDRRHPARRSTSSHRQDHPAAGRLGPEEPGLRGARRDRPGRELVRLPLPAPARQPGRRRCARAVSPIDVVARTPGIGSVALLAAVSRGGTVPQLERLAAVQPHCTALVVEHGRSAADGDVSGRYRHRRQPAPQGDLRPYRRPEQLALGASSLSSSLSRATRMMPDALFIASQGIAALYEFQKEHPEASARIATWCVRLPSPPLPRSKLTLSMLAGWPARAATSRRTSSARSPTSRRPTASAPVSLPPRPLSTRLRPVRPPLGPSLSRYLT